MIVLDHHMLRFGACPEQHKKLQCSSTIAAKYIPVHAHYACATQQSRAQNHAQPGCGGVVVQRVSTYLDPVHSPEVDGEPEGSRVWRADGRIIRDGVLDQLHVLSFSDGHSSAELGRAGRNNTLTPLDAVSRNAYPLEPDRIVPRSDAGASGPLDKIVFNRYYRDIFAKQDRMTGSVQQLVSSDRDILCPVVQGYETNSHHCLGCQAAHDVVLHSTSSGIDFDGNRLALYGVLLHQCQRS